MECRTFYDREDLHIKTYFEPCAGPEVEDIVQPNLSLSIREIFDRWQRNLPLDLMQRNGTFMIQSNEDETDEQFNSIDIDSMDPAELIEYKMQIESKLRELSKTSQSEGDQRSEMPDTVDESSNSLNEDSMSSGVDGSSDSGITSNE